MEATRCLRDEHQLILKVLDCFEIALHAAQDSQRVTRAVFEPFVEFFRGFADRCHHCKEEDRLFPCLESEGVPREGGPIGVMLTEHQRARTHVRAMREHLDAADAGDSGAVHTILEHGGNYLQLLRAHIAKEDHCLFAMADQLIQGAGLTDLTNAYRDAEGEPEYCATLKRCRAIADELTQNYSVAEP